MRISLFKFYWDLKNNSAPSHINQMEFSYHGSLRFIDVLCISILIKRWVFHKETKGRSSGQTPFTIKPKQLALKKQFLTPQKYFPNFFLIFFTFVSSNFSVRTLQCKKKYKKLNFCPWIHEKTALKSCS